MQSEMDTQTLPTSEPQSAHQTDCVKSQGAQNLPSQTCVKSQVHKISDLVPKWPNPGGPCGPKPIVSNDDPPSSRVDKAQIPETETQTKARNLEDFCLNDNTSRVLPPLHPSVLILQPPLHPTISPTTTSSLSDDAPTSTSSSVAILQPAVHPRWRFLQPPLHPPGMMLQPALLGGHSPSSSPSMTIAPTTTSSLNDDSPTYTSSSVAILQPAVHPR